MFCHVIGSIKRKYLLSCNWKHQEKVSVVMSLEASRESICCHVIGSIKRKNVLSCNWKHQEKVSVAM